MARHDTPRHEGDVLGISDANPEQKLPVSGRRDNRRPSGIEVGNRVTGIGDVRQRPGADGADLGGHEETDVTPEMPDVEEKPRGLNDD